MFVFSIVLVSLCKIFVFFLTAIAPIHCNKLFQYSYTKNHINKNVPICEIILRTESVV